MRTKKTTLRRAALLLAAPLMLGLAGCGGEAEEAGGEAASSPVTVDGEMTIAENLAETEALSGFNALVGSAGLTEALAGVGPYTVFAPTNDAVESLGDIGEMEMPARAALVSYHIIPGLVTAADLESAIEAEDGPVELATLTGATLSASQGEDGPVITDGAGNAVAIADADLVQQNGVVHIVERVLQPD